MNVAKDNSPAIGLDAALDYIFEASQRLEKQVNAHKLPPYRLPKAFAHLKNTMPASILFMLPLQSIDTSKLAKASGLHEAAECKASSLSSLEQLHFSVMLLTTMGMHSGGPTVADERLKARKADDRMNAVMPAVINIWQQSLQRMEPVQAVTVLSDPANIEFLYRLNPEGALGKALRPVISQIRQQLPASQKHLVDELRAGIKECQRTTRLSRAASERLANKVDAQEALLLEDFNDFRRDSIREPAALTFAPGNLSGAQALKYKQIGKATEGFRAIASKHDDEPATICAYAMHLAQRVSPESPTGQQLPGWYGHFVREMKPVDAYRTLDASHCHVQPGNPMHAVVVNSLIELDARSDDSLKPAVQHMLKTMPGKPGLKPPAA